MATKFVARCPECGSTDLRHARRRLLDAIPFVFIMTPLRCRKCLRRFFNWRWERLESDDPVEIDSPSTSG
jgi:predicted Zn-ribbon and HTH transcriptional regulator